MLRRRLAGTLKCSASELPARLDNNLVRVDVSYPERFSADGLARVEIGLTALNPVPPEVLDHIWLRENFGDKLAFYSGVSTQTMLPHGTPAEVRLAVAACCSPHRSA